MPTIETSLLSILKEPEKTSKSVKSTSKTVLAGGVETGPRRIEKKLEVCTAKLSMLEKG